MQEKRRCGAAKTAFDSFCLHLLWPGLRNPTDFCMDLITPGTKTAQERVFIQPPGLVRGVELAKRSLAHLARYFSENQLTMIDELVEREIENATLESATKRNVRLRSVKAPWRSCKPCGSRCVSLVSCHLCERATGDDVCA